MGYILYLDYISQPCRALALLLKHNNIGFEEILIDIFAGEASSENFLKINPAHKVPVLDDDGWILTESVAMMKYLLTKEKLPDHWYPADLKRRARVEEFISWHHLSLRFHCIMLFLNSFRKFDFVKGFHPGTLKGGVDDETMGFYVVNVEKYLNHIENYFLKRSDFLAGDEISIADLFGMSELQQPESAGYDIKRNRPKLAAWLERVKSFGKNFDDVSRKIVEFGGKRQRSFQYE